MSAPIFIYTVPRLGDVEIAEPTWADVCAAQRAAPDGNEQFIEALLSRVVRSIAGRPRVLGDKWDATARVTNTLWRLVDELIAHDAKVGAAIIKSRSYLADNRVEVTLPDGRVVGYRAPYFSEYLLASSTADSLAEVTSHLAEIVLLDVAGQPWRRGNPWPLDARDSNALAALVLDECMSNDDEVVAAKGSVRVVNAASAASAA